MDPLSITASIITVIGCIKASYSTLRRLSSRGSTESSVLAIINEITDYEALLRHINSMHALQESFETPGNLFSLLENAKLEIMELDRLIQYDILQPSSTKKSPKVFLLQWIKNANKIEKLLGNLQRTRVSITLQLTVDIRNSMSRIELSVDKINYGIESSETKVQNMDQITSTRIESLEERLGMLEQSISPTGPQTFSTEDSFIDTRPVSPNNLLQSQDSEFLTSESLMISNLQDGTHTTIGARKVQSVQVDTLQYQTCPSFCSCKCHQCAYLQTPYFLNKILGRLFVGYSSAALFRQSCNEYSCKRKRHYIARVTYYFPLWFLKQQVSAIIALEPSAGPSLSLTTARIRHQSDHIFYMSYDGDIDHVRRWFKRGLASSRDVTHVTHTSLLHFAIQQENIEFAKFLLTQNADPYSESIAHATPLSIGWEKILAGTSRSPESLRALLEECDNDEYTATQQFSIIHKIVLGLIPGNLSAELSRSTSTINAVDVNAKTALSWAALRGDHSSVLNLLERGACPDLIAKDGESPLHMAARAGSVPCTKILLQHHVPIDHKEHHGNTALHYTAKVGGTSDGHLGCSKHLVNAGANIDAQDVTGKTPVRYCVESNARNIAAYLLNAGADIERSTNDGMSPLLAAIYYNQHGMLRFLVEHGATWATKTRYGTVFHIAASKADAATMSILKTEMGASAKRRPPPLIPSSDTKDADGHDAKEVMADRAAQNPEFVPLFDDLLESVSQN